MAQIAAGSVGVDPANISSFEELQLGGGLDLELTVKDVDEFCALEDLRGELALVAIGKEFSETGDDMAVRDQ